MISQDDLQLLVKKYKISESVVLREYVQLLFLQTLYSFPFSKDIFFKGGTAIRLLLGGERFSEDLDFTVQMDNDIFEKHMITVFNYLSKNFSITAKQRKSVAGKTQSTPYPSPPEQASICHRKKTLA